MPEHDAGVMVVHPGVQHSRELARALQNGGLLKKLVTSTDDRLTRLLPRSMRQDPRRWTGLPGSKVCSVGCYEIAVRIGSALFGSDLTQRMHEWALDQFGRSAARRVRREVPRIVAAFEGGAERVFQAAHWCGALAVLEAPSLHPAWQPGAEAPQDERRGDDARKARELELADHLVVLSTVARDSYVAAGIPPERISIVPPGVWTDRIAERREPVQGPVRVLFVGNVKRAKGVDLLLAAFRTVGPGATLVIAGAIVEPHLLARLPGHVEVLGKIDAQGLRSQYARAGLLVLPSRADGFGMVVGEAMRSGLPVVVSSATGARDVVVPGRNGWIFPSGDASALAAVLEDAISDRMRLRDMGANAREDSAGLTWERYAERTVALYRALLAGARPPQVLE